MDTSSERELNEAAYRQLKDTIAKTYPYGRFVAIAGGRVVADAENLRKLQALLHERLRASRRTGSGGWGRLLRATDYSSSGSVIMTGGSYEQRNPYKGTPPRPWIRVRLLAPNGTPRELELVADTGSPSALIIGQATMTSLSQLPAATRTSNFGPLIGGVLHVHMPEVGVDQDLLSYASDTVVTFVQKSHPDFEGLVGLSFLRLMEFGGDADWFWIRPARLAGPTSPPPATPP